MLRKFFFQSGAALLVISMLAWFSAARGTITFQFDYTYDSGNFFGLHPQAKTLLNDAAQFYGAYITDNLSAINASAQSTLDHNPDTWTTDAFNPSDPNNSAADIKVQNLVVPANTLIIYVGGATNLGGTELGLGGYGGYTDTGFSNTWFNTVSARGQAGALASTPTDFGPWGGSIAFSSTANWYFDSDPSTSDVPSNSDDFYSVALHELGHLLGIGTAPSWQDQISGSGSNAVFTGSHATTANGGVHPRLDSGLGHWKDGTMSTIFGTHTSQETEMDPTLTIGTRKYVTTLDMAALQDIGWQISSPAAAAITNNPGNFTAVAGGLASFKVAASGTTPITYQWQVSTDGGTTFGNLTDGVGLKGSATASLLLATTTGSDAGTGNLYRCFVSNNFGNATSNAATLTVNVPPIITTPPAGLSLIVGQTANFSVVVSGASTMPILYHWQKNSVNIANATSADFSIANVTAADAGRYTVVVSNPGGSVTSAVVTLVVNVPPTTSTPTNVAVIAGKPASFSVVAAGTKPFTYKWQVSTDGGSSFGNLTDGLGVKGSATAKLSLTTTANSTAGNGNIYQCLVTNAGGNITSPSATLTVGIVPKITAQPTKTTAITGNVANFTVTSSGSGTLNYQWQSSTKGTTWTNLSNSSNISGATSSILSVNATATLYYRAVVTNVVGTATTAKSLLTVTFPPGGIYFGTFAGTNGAGKFASLVQSNNDTLIIGYDTTHKEGFSIPSFFLDGNGSFTTSGGVTSTVSGNFTTSTVSTVTGTVSDGGKSSTLKGIHKSDIGNFAFNAGFYTGTFSSGSSDKLQIMLAADGTMIVYVVFNSSGDNGDGATGTVGATGAFTFTTINGTKITGTLDLVNNAMSGTFKTKNGTTGTFSLSLDIAP